MLRIDRQKRTFVRLDVPTMAQASFLERQDLQECIRSSPDDFFAEIGERLFMMGTEVPPSKTVPDRIDLLGLDKEGAAVIIELKRGSHKLHLLQAISYAGMVAHWEPSDFVEFCQEAQREALVEFLDVEPEEINRQQRIILLAEAFEYEVLVAAEWLSEQYGVNVVCARVALSRDSASGQEYLVCNTVYPAPELAAEARPRSRARERSLKPRWRDWDEALSRVKNPAVADFFRRELDAGRESYLPKRILRYRVDGKRRFALWARAGHSYAWQSGRFDGDIDLWREGLSRPDDVTPVKDASCLRFRLETPEDFACFARSVSGPLQSAEWEGFVEDASGDEAVTPGE